MKKNKLIAVFAATVLTMMPLLSGCTQKADPTMESNAVAAVNTEKVTQEQTQAQADDSKPIIGVMIFDYANNYVTYIRNAITSVAGEDVEIQMVDAQNDQSKQVEQIDLMINKGAKVLCVNAVDPTAAQTIIAKAKAADIPLIFFNRCPSEADMNSYDKCWYVGTTPYDSGKMQAELAMEIFKQDTSYDKNGDGILQYVILKGTLGHPDAEARTLANEETFEKAGFGAELLDVQTGDFKTATAKDVMDVWMGKYGDEIEMVFANNDAMLLGAIESGKTEGYFTGDDSKRMGAIGINALPEVLGLIEDGTINGSILSDAYSEGNSIYTMAHNLISGKDVMNDIDGELDEMKALRVPYVSIVKENVPFARDIYEKVLGK